MLDKISVKNFKSIDQLNVNLTNLNILSGINNSGKSSFIQSILLFKSLRGNQQSVNLNNEYIELGTVEDILFEGGGDTFEIEFTGLDQRANFIFKSKSKKQDYLDFAPNIKNTNERYTLPNNKTIPKVLMELEYLKAERVGPKVTQQRNSYCVAEQKSIGVSGEYSYEYLTNFINEKLTYIQNRAHIEAQDSILGTQLTYWLREICPNIKIESKLLENTNLSTTSFSLESQFGSSKQYRPTNVGFGLSYVLPVVLLCLKAKPGQLIIIDTPEAHLHPRGQFKIGELLAKTAADGVQLIIETHSDHIINGIRLAVVEGFLEYQQTNFLFFSLTQKKNRLTYSTKIQIPKLNELGQFDFWPDGFFDQWNQSIKKLIMKQLKND